MSRLTALLILVLLVASLAGTAVVWRKTSLDRSSLAVASQVSEFLLSQDAADLLLSLASDTLLQGYTPESLSDYLEYVRNSLSYGATDDAAQQLALLAPSSVTIEGEARAPLFDLAADDIAASYLTIYRFTDFTVQMRLELRRINEDWKVEAFLLESPRLDH